jgi:photosystem II stability/assembly factor-like uncharacterized protein
MRYCWLVLAACTGTTRPVLTQDDAGSADAHTNLNPWLVVASGTTTDLYGVSGTGPSDVVAVGGDPANTNGMSGVAVRWNGTAWTMTTNLVNLMSISGGTAVGVYGGEGSESYWNGATWAAREVLGAGFMRGTWEASPGTYAVGDGGNLVYTSETGIPGSWGAVPSNTTNALYGVWGSSTSDILAVGAGGVILHNTTAGVGVTGTWVKSIASSSTLTGVWGSSASDVYVVGTAPAVILHSTDGGTSWSSMAPPASAIGLYAVGGRSATDIYAVGATGGVIFHSSGNDVWTSETSPTTVDLFGVWEASSGDVYAVGRGGTILHKLP